jgi:hypothetical protein
MEINDPFKGGISCENFIYDIVELYVNEVNVSIEDL